MSKAVHRSDPLKQAPVTDGAGAGGKDSLKAATAMPVSAPSSPAEDFLLLSTAPQAPPSHMTLAQVANALGLRRSTVSERVMAGEFGPSFHYFGETMIQTTEVIRRMPKPGPQE